MAVAIDALMIVLFRLIDATSKRKVTDRSEPCVHSAPCATPIRVKTLAIVE